MKLKNTTKMGLQAAIAILIAEWISWYFELHRGYWLTLTAMALTMQTWGESITRSLERVSMTILGGAFGTLLYFSLPHNQTLIFCLLLVCVFFTVYLLQIYYLIAVFSLTCFVVFLFSLINEWSLLILRDRIFETGLGAIIALGVGFCFHTFKGGQTYLFADFINQLNVSLTMMFKHHKGYEESQVLATKYQKLRKQTVAIRYEFFFHQLSRREFYVLINNLSICTQYVINLIDAYHWVRPYLSEDERKQIAEALETTRHNMDLLVDHIKNKTETTLISVTRLTELMSQDIAKDPKRFMSLESEALGFFSLMYFFTRLNLCLNEINVMVKSA